MFRKSLRQRAAIVWQRYSAWAERNRQKELKAMPALYLFTSFAFSTFLATVCATKLGPVTIKLLELEAWPVEVWPLLVLVGLFWVIFLFALLISQSHVRALADKFFNSPTKSMK